LAEKIFGRKYLAKTIWPKTPFPEKYFGRNWTRSDISGNLP